MSVARKVNVVYDLKTIEKVAKELGFEVKHNETIRGYGGASYGKGQIVIRGGGDYYDIGFTEKEDGTIEMNADFHGGAVDKKLEKIIPAYMESKIRASRRFKIRERTSTANEIKMVVVR